VRRAATLVAAAAALALPTAATAACPKTTLGDVEDEVMCSICKTPLAVAEEAPQAQRERAFIEREIAACKSKDQIKRALVAQFGDRVLALPPDKGFNLAAYLVPAAIVLLGIGAVATVAVRRRRRGQATAPPTPSLAGDDAARLQADIERYDL
jgi:cytochrome c-type biogenesis protein CcmH/NrfF